MRLHDDDDDDDDDDYDDDDNAAADDGGDDDDDDDDIDDDVIKWKHFPRYWPFVRGIHRSRWIPRTKASDAELWCFLSSASE